MFFYIEVSYIIVILYSKFYFEYDYIDEYWHIQSYPDMYGIVYIQRILYFCQKIIH